MEWNELKKRIIVEYNKRKLKSDVRYKALEKVEVFIKQTYPGVIDDVTTLPSDKSIVKDAYEEYTAKKLNGAESSVINEIYNQIQVRLSE